MTTTRRTVLARAATSVAAGIAAPAILAWPAGAAEFSYKYGTALPDGHPMAIRSREAIAKIKDESGGRLDITFYPSSVLGQDTAMSRKPATDNPHMWIPYQRPAASSANFTQ